MDLALNKAVLLTGSVGLSIVFLSILVNTVLLPLYYLAEKWQNKERNIQHRMAPGLAEIKKSCRGEEQYNRTVSLYKEFSYHPIKSLRTSFGFLIQVPFFIAAYTLLSHNPLLDNVPFLFLNNLGMPDALIPFSGINIILGFILFRFFDILKPYPINISQKLPNGWGVMIDDVLAAIYANIALRLILLIIN